MNSKMPSATRTFRTQQLAWRTAAAWLVVLAMGLAIAGIILAIVQTRSLTTRLMAPVEAQASGVADRALRLFNREVAAALESVGSHVYEQRDDPWLPPPGFPTWLDGIYVRRGQGITLLALSTDPRRELSERISARLLAKPPHAVEQSGSKIDILYDILEDKPVVIACLESQDAAGARIVIAGHINLDRLRRDFIEPLLPMGSGLELVIHRPETRHAPWSQRLLSAMRFWEIKPTETFVREQAKTVLRQTLVHLGLTIIAIITLLVAMGVLVRSVRREMALTEMKSNFVADVSHELKTPLALIRLFGETLQSGRVVSEEKRKEYYEIITRESTRLTNLIDNILDFARIDAGEKEYLLEPTDIAAVVRRTYEAYRAQLDHARFEHHLTAAAALPLVDADADAISQALINLIHNAIKYSGEERSLAIDITEDTRRGGRGVLISVHDRGIGIKPEDRARLFDGFFRAGDAFVREQGGTGLGLALVKHIVDGHGGSLHVESRLVKGSTFRIFLPASSGPIPESKKIGPRGSNGGGTEVQ